MKPKPGFRPLFWLTFFCIPGFLLLMSLGVWQVHRLQWKLGLLHNITLAQKADPVSFKGFMALQPSDVPLFWRHVEVQGDYVQPSIFTLFVYQPYRGGIGCENIHRDRLRFGCFSVLYAGREVTQQLVPMLLGNVWEDLTK